MAGGLLPPVVVELVARTGQFKADMASAGAEMGAFAAETEGAGSKAVAALKGVVVAGAAVGAAAAAVGVVSVKMASDFQASMEKLHTQANVPQKDIAGLSSAVLDLAGKVGTNPDSLAEALFHVESTFQSTGKTGAQMMEILRIGAEGARVGGSDLVDTQNALDAAIVSGIRGAENLQSAMGLLNATVGVGDMTMQNLAEALSSGVMPVVKNYGLSLTDVGAALATFGDNNIRGAQAGTALRMSVQAMAVPIQGGKAALEAMGMTMSTMAKDMQSGGLLKALEDLKSHMDAAGITGDQVGEELTTIFGKRAGTGVAVLINGLDLLKSKYPELTAAAGGFGDAWSQTSNTLKQQIADIHAAFDAMMIRLGLVLIPLVLSGLKAARTAIDSFRGGWENAKASIDSGVGGIDGTFLRIGQSARMAFDYLSTWFRQNWPEIRATAVEGFDRIRTAVQNVVEWISVRWPDIESTVVSTFKTIETEVTDFVDFVETIWRNYHDNIMGAVDAAWTYMRDTIQGVLLQIRGIFEFFDGLIHGDWSMMWQGMKDIVAGAWDDMKAAVSLALQALGGIVEAGMRPVISGILLMVSTVVNLADKAFGWIPGLGGKLDDARKAVDSFRQQVNDSLAGITKNVDVTVTTHNVQVNSTQDDYNANLGAGRSYFEAMGGMVGRAMAAGGQITTAASGYTSGFMTSGPTLVGEGNPMWPEFVVATDPAYHSRNVDLWMKAGKGLGMFGSGSGSSSGPSGISPVGGVTIILNGPINLPGVTDTRTFWRDLQAEGLRYQRANGGTGIKV